jgi:hypothetical protein
MKTVGNQGLLELEKLVNTLIPTWTIWLQTVRKAGGNKAQ